MPSFPPLVVSGQTIGSAHMNGLRNALISSYSEIYAWTANVNAAGRSLQNVGAITSGAITTSGNIQISAGAPQLRLNEADGGGNAKLWKQYAEAGILHFTCANDADSAETDWMAVSRTAATPTGITIPGTISVGIGAPPLAALYVLRGATDEHIRFTNDAANYYYLGRRASDGLCVLGGNQASPNSGLVLAFGGQERMRVTAGSFWLKPDVLPVFESNGAAIAGGLTAGFEYRTSDGTRKQVF